MGRRKKEPESVHRENIASTAGRLFSRKGIEAATMDDIAKEAGYSKATLYVYFENKEEIIGFLVSKSMKILHWFVSEAVTEPASVKEKYDKICRAVTQYQEQYPLYFSLALSKINVDLDKPDCLPVEKDIFETGERINEVIAGFICSGIRSGDFQPDLPVKPTVFLFWAAISGLLQMSVNKVAYLEKAMHLTKRDFLEFGFERFYKMIEKDKNSK